MFCSLFSRLALVLNILLRDVIAATDGNVFCWAQGSDLTFERCCRSRDVPCFEPPLSYESCCYSGFAYYAIEERRLTMMLEVGSDAWSLALGEVP